jgi:hypothetical protein
MSERTSSAVRGNEGLAFRRRKQRRRGLIAFSVLILILLGLLLYGLWRPAFRVAHVEVSGGDATLSTIAEQDMQGSYLGIIPRNSTFFLPINRIRSDILQTHLTFAAVSIGTTGFTSLSITTDARTPVGRWCGMSIASSSAQDTPAQEVTPMMQNTCYLFDPNGLVYGTATEPWNSQDVSSSSPELVGLNPDQTLTPYVVFDVLSATTSPLGATLQNATQLPAIFEFARQLESLGPAVQTIVVRGDEVDFFLMSTSSAVGPRITYLLGDEQNALTALVSAKGQLNLSDPTLEYVDLRFSGRIYFKRNSP